MDERIVLLVDLFEAHALSFVGHRILLRLFWFSDLNACTVFLFTVHEEYPGAVALTGCARGDHTHYLASYFLVPSSIASSTFQVKTGVSYCLDYYVETCLRWWSSLSLFQSLTQTLSLM